MIARVLIFFLVALVPRVGLSQHKVQLPVAISDQDREVLDELGFVNKFESIRHEDNLEDFISLLHGQGYLLASYKTIYSDDISIGYEIETGHLYKWIKISSGNIPEFFEKRARNKLAEFQGHPVMFSQITKLFNEILDYSENAGYPFATVNLEKIAIEMANNTLTANLHYNPGPFISFDSLIITNSKTKPAFLMAYLGFKKGDPYKQKNINLIPSLINKLQYLELKESPEIQFDDSLFKIHLNIRDKPSNSFNGVVGFLPNENQPGKVLVTGIIYLGLNNLFNSGKQFEFDWNKLNLETQELKISYLHPNLFRSQVDVSLLFDLYKQDTSFLNREGLVEFIFHGIGQGSFGLKASFQSSALLFSDKTQVESHQLADYNISYYGLSYTIKKYNDWIFPRMGWDLNVDLNVGSKDIKRSSTFGAAMDNADQSVQVSFLSSSARYFPIKNRSTLITRISGGYVSNTNLLWNEIYRLGGLHSIRGFNEKFFYASSYLYLNLEYRFSFDNESQLLLFYDQGFLTNQLSDGNLHDYPAGIGSGFNLKTKFGILTLLYALGSSKEQPFGLDYSKFHVGYTNRF